MAPCRMNLTMKGPGQTVPAAGTAAGPTLSLFPLCPPSPNPACSVPAHHGIHPNAAPLGLATPGPARPGPARPGTLLHRTTLTALTGPYLDADCDGSESPSVSDRLSLFAINFPNPHSLKVPFHLPDQLPLSPLPKEVHVGSNHTNLLHCSKNNTTG